MEKFLLQVELRYCSIPKSEYGAEHNFEYTTIGIYDTITEACNKGNEILDRIIVKHNLKVYREKFGEHNGCFGRPNLLVTNCCSSDKIKYFAQITRLRFLDLDERIDNAITKQDEYDKWYYQQEEE